METSLTIDFAGLCRQFGIALTGGIASGKSTVAGMLRARSYLVIDADQVSRQVVAPGTAGLSEVVRAFGPDVLDSSGAMDRAQMRTRIFADAEARQTLEGIIHRRLAEGTARILEAEGFFESPRLWFYEASLIYERKREDDFREVWVAHCSPEVQLSRLIARDGSSPEAAAAILAAQLSPEEKKRRAHRTIDTEGPLAQLEVRLDETLAQLPAELSRTRERR